MKIGEFARKNNTTIDTVRYYMELKLILPNKNGGQYDFDETCKNDLEEIVKLKESGFSLSEIRYIFKFKRIGKGIEYEKDKLYKEFFIKKLMEVDNNIKCKLKMRRKLKRHIKEIDNSKVERKSIVGIDINTLNLLGCPKCGRNLSLSYGSIEENKVTNGKLKCICGKDYNIRDGIIFGENYINTSEAQDSWHNISEYINNIDYGYIENLSESIGWFKKQAYFKKIQNKIILDLGSGMGLTLRSFYDRIEENSVYIAVDYDLRRQEFLRNIIAGYTPNKNIILMCCDFNEIPLIQNTVDLIIDGSGSSAYAFDNKEFLLSKIERYLKKSSVLAGLYIIFENFSLSSVVRTEFRSNFKIENVKINIDNLNYKLVEECKTAYLQAGGKYDKFFSKDERVYFYTCLYKR